MKRIYRGFKTECPSGLITEEGFHAIYSRFFPQRGESGFSWMQTWLVMVSNKRIGNFLCWVQRGSDNQMRQPKSDEIVFAFTTLAYCDRKLVQLMLPYHLAEKTRKRAEVEAS